MNAARRLCLLALLVCGCGEPLLEPQRIERPRLLGARLEVEGDPERAWPVAGEAVALQWLLAGPAAPLASSYAFVACGLGEVKTNGPLRCSEPPFAAVLQATPSLAQPSFAFVIPEAPAFTRFGILGSVCAGGTAAVAGAEVTCAGDSVRKLAASFDTRLQTAESNHRPLLGAAALRLAGSEWPAPLAAGDPGCNAAQPRLSAAAGSALIELELDASQREAVPVMEVGPGRESLQLSLAATAGRLEHAYIVVSPDDARERVPVTVGWELPSRAPETGLAVRVYFVLRDLRGGVDWLERDACVVP